MKYLLFYEFNNDSSSKVPLHFPAHRARLVDFHDRGAALMGGPLTDAEDGALVLFTTREVAEEFAEGDAFVTGGVVSRWYIREWDEALSGT